MVIESLKSSCLDSNGCVGIVCASRCLNFFNLVGGNHIEKYGRIKLSVNVMEMFANGIVCLAGVKR
uniref:Uncharacterized protein n=1 Tax=Daphnia galeata TaxID=27404 RepID=A0A8J2S4N7_9CRUS|nr:unnamed protein product [Daphnia galeata]